MEVFQATKGNETAVFAVRDAAEADKAFIYNSWLKSFRDAPAVRTVPNKHYFDGHHKCISAVMSSPGFVCYIACNDKDPEQIYGYLVAERKADGLVIHWIYCKHPFRGFGIASTLEEKLLTDIDARTVRYSSKVKNITRILKDRPYIYNPYDLMGK